MKRILLMCLAILISLLAYSESRAKRAYLPIDDLGNRCEVSEPQRIVSLAPNVTEMLFYLGFGGRVVGVSDYCDWPPEVTGLPTVGGLIDTSLEAVVALEPDLIIAYQGNSRELVEQLLALDISVFCLNEAANLHEVGQQMSRLDLIVSKLDEVDAFDFLYGGYTDKLDAYELSLDQLTRKYYSLQTGDLDTTTRFTVFYGYPGEMIYTAGGNTFINDLIERAGGLNCAWRLTGWPAVSAEFLLDANPDYILTGTSCTEDEDPAEVKARLLAELKADQVWRNLDAVQAGRVIVIDADILNRPGPRLLDALMEFYRQLDQANRPPQYELLLEAGY
ncbi:ABC transporter substrate-binding protein [bacterium]|nr:ABC transporter substrate-binding protein [bacterium]